MPVYVLPEPTAIERRLARAMGGPTRRLAEWKVFPGGEDFVRVAPAGREATVIGRLAPPGDNFFRTALLLDTLKRSGTKRLTLLLPYFAYSRQDRSLRTGEPVTASCLTSLLAAAGASRIVTVDLHSDRVAAASPIPVISASVLPELAMAVRKHLPDGDITVVSPDRGGRARARLFAAALGLPAVAWIEKARDAAGRAAAKSLHGRLRGRTAVIVDDMVDTGGTVAEAARLLRRDGCQRLYLCATHPLFSGEAVETVHRLKLERIVVSNTLPIPPELSAMEGVIIVDCTKTLMGACRGDSVV